MRMVLERKVVLVGLLAILVVGLVIGCQRKKKLEDGGVTTIRYENWEGLPEQLASHKKVVDAFNEKHPDIHVEFQPIVGGYQKILTEIAGRAAPDVFYWCSSILPALVEKKATMNLTPYINASMDINLDDYFPGLFETVKYNDNIYAFPFNWGTKALVYNKDLFDKSQIEYPNDNWTWEDFLNAAQKLTIREEGRVVQYGSLRLEPTWIIMQFGGDIFNNEVTKCTMNNPEVKEALQFMLNLERKYKVAPTFAEIEGSEKLRGELGMFMSGRAAMFFPSSWAIPTLNTIKDFQWDVASFPRVKDGKRRTSCDPGILCISTQTEHPKEAWEFVRFACGKEGQGYFGKNSIPAIKNIAYNNFCTPPPVNIRVVIEQIEEPVILNLFRRPWSSEFYDTVYKIELDKLFLGQQTIEIDEVVEKITFGASKFLEKK